MKYLQILVLGVILAGLFTARAGAQILTDRPDQTEGSSTVGKGNLQIEAGLLIGFMGDGPFSTRQILAPTTLFRYGITSGIELRLLNQLESSKIRDQVTQGISDMEFGAKIELYQKEGSRTAVAFVSHILVPTGAAEFTNDAFGTINKVAVSHIINESMGLGYNVGYNYLGSGSGDITYSIVLGIGLSDRLGIYAEPYGELANMEDFILNFDTGLTYLVKENLQLDFSFGSGINQRMNYISVGCCWKLEK